MNEINYNQISEAIMENVGAKLPPSLQEKILEWLKYYLQMRVFVKRLLEQNDGKNQFTKEFNEEISFWGSNVRTFTDHPQNAVKSFIDGLHKKNHLLYIKLSGKMSTDLFKIICLCCLAKKFFDDILSERAKDEKHRYRIGKEKAETVYAKYLELLVEYNRKIEEIFKDRPQYKELAWFIFDDVIDIRYMDESFGRIEQFDNATEVRVVGKQKVIKTTLFKDVIGLNRFAIPADIVFDFVVDEKLERSFCAGFFQKMRQEIDERINDMESHVTNTIHYRDRDINFKHKNFEWLSQWTKCSESGKEIDSQFKKLLEGTKPLEKENKKEKFPREITKEDMKKDKIFSKKHPKLLKAVKSFLKDKKQYRLIFETREATDAEKIDEKKDEFIAVISIFLPGEEAIVRFSSKYKAEESDEEKSEKASEKEYKSEKKVHKITISKKIIEAWNSVQTKGDWNPADSKYELFAKDLK